MPPVLAILGTGRLGEAIVGSLLRSGWTEPERIVCTDVDAERRELLAGRYGVVVTEDPADAVSRAELVLIAVKPQNMRELLASVAPSLTPAHTLISVAAGVTTERIEALVPPGVAVIRVMPNTPALVGEAMSALAPGRHAGDAQLALAESLLTQVGRVVRVEEPALDAVTAVSGSGPAYVFLLAEAMAAAGEAVGLEPGVARELVAQTLVGSAALLREEGRSAAELREMVTSPGGTTQAALEVLESRGLREAIRDAIAAAERRSRELAEGG
jgi:pyrroline-5-carboxylate reductase